MNLLPLDFRPPKSYLELDIPLNVDTDSELGVALLVGTLLNDIAAVDGEASHADILQALAITSAVRTAMAEASATRGADVPFELLDLQIASAGGNALRAA